MTALVTLFGGGGFVGRYVAQALLRQGARVRIVQRDPRRAFFLKPQGGLGQTQFVAADVTKPRTVERAVAGSDAVVNLAGVLAGRFEAVHVDGARHVAEAAARAGAGAFIHVSAIGADPASPSAYGRSKAAGEAAVLAALPTATILRPSTIVGREDQFVNRFAGMIEAASQLPFSPLPVMRPSVRFQPVFVGDVADAVVAALDREDAAGRTVELGGPDIVTMRGLHEWIAGVTGRRVNLIDVPDLVGALIARTPGTPISQDQWLMLQRDTVVAPGAADLASLGVVPTPIASVAPQWLVRFRRKGRFGARVETLAPTPIA